MRYSGRSLSEIYVHIGIRSKRTTPGFLNAVIYHMFEGRRLGMRRNTASSFVVRSFYDCHLCSRPWRPSLVSVT